MLNLEKNKHYLLACSYGPDSMALFHLLIEEGYSFEVAHVNYKLRKESTKEALELQDYCNKNNIAFHLLELGYKITKNIEEVCRETRYEFFASVMYENLLDYVLVAHHQDDLIETYYLQKKRNIIPNFYGISQLTTIKDVPVIRPLLNFTKKDLLNICIDNNIPFCIDKTNLEDTFERNKIRHSIIDNLSTEDRKSILKEINDNNLLLERKQNVAKSIDTNLVSEILQYEQDVIQIYFNYLIHKYDDELFISKRQISEFIKVLRNEKANIIVPIKDGFYLFKEYDYFSIKRVTNLDYSYTLEKPSVLDTPFFYIDLTHDQHLRNVSDSDYPLTIRNAKPNDKVQIKNYICEFRRLAIDWKMPISTRKRWPLIVNNKGEVIYIPRYRKDFVPNKTTNMYVK